MKCRYCKKDFEIEPCRRCMHKIIKQLKADNEVLTEDLAIMTGNYQTHAKINEDHQADIDRMGIQIEAQREELEQHRWIPVSEGLPEERKDLVPFRSEDVFVTNGISARRAYWMTRQKHWRFYHEGWNLPITHWKPIILSEQSPERQT